MAVLSASDRAALRQAFPHAVERLAGADRSIGIDKPQLLAVVNAIDDWVDANSASFNQAIPQPQRGILTARQKALLLSLVVARRFEA